MFNIKDKVLFDDNKEYIITSKVNCANSNYYMLLERKNFSNVFLLTFTSQRGILLV